MMKADVIVYDLSTGKTWTNVKKLRPRNKVRLPRKFKKKMNRLLKDYKNNVHIQQLRQKIFHDLVMYGTAEISFTTYAKPIAVDVLNKKLDASTKLGD